jgi:hypothetical protein
MFTIKQALITIKVVVTLGTTIVVATAASTTPTNAALLNFNFSTGKRIDGKLYLRYINSGLPILRN